MHIQNPEILCYEDSVSMGTVNISRSMALIAPYSVLPVTLVHLMF